MTWKEFIYSIGEEVRSPDFWPMNGEQITQEHIDRVHTVLVTRAAQMPLHRIAEDLGTSTEAVTLSGTGLKYGNLPATLFSRRTDKGINLLTIDGKVFSPEEASPLMSLTILTDNPYQQGNIRFGVNSTNTKIFIASGTSCNIEFVPEPVRPTLASVNADLPWLINDQDTEVIAQGVASHIAAVRNRDTQAAQIHQALSNFYSGDVNG